MACCVPDLCLDRLCVDLNGSGCELDADGGLGVKVEFISGESAEEIGFTDARVTDQDDWGGVLVDGDDSMTVCDGYL